MSKNIEAAAKRSTRPLDPDLLAMNRISRIMAELDQDARVRVLKYLASREGAFVSDPACKVPLRTEP